MVVGVMLRMHVDCVFLKAPTFFKPQLLSTSEEKPECWLPRSPALWPLFSSLAHFLSCRSGSLLFLTSQIPCTCVPSLHGVIFLWIFVTLYSLSFLFICQAKKFPLATLFEIVSSCPQCAISLSSLILLSAPVTF